MKKQWLADKQIAGLGILALPSGVKTWYLRYREPSGKQQTQKLGSAGIITVRVAREEAHKILAAVARGEAPGTTRKLLGKGPTVADLYQRVAETHYPKLRPASVIGYNVLWRKHMLPAIGSEKVATLGSAQVMRMIEKLPRIQANRSLAVLRKALNLAELWEMRPRGSNPCRGVPSNAERKRERYLTEDELARLLDACEEFAVTPLRWRFTQLIKLLLFTGARRDEIRAARWDWVDERTGQLVIPADHHKTGSDGHRRTIYLSPPAMRVLRDLRKQARNGWIIAGQDDGPLVGVGKMWAQLLEIAGIKNLRVHDLRHSYASFANDAGLSLPQIGGLLGHKSPITTARYLHLRNKTAAQIAAKVSAQIKNPR